MKNITNLLLADDDCDDCMLFREALDDLAINVNLLVASNGIELMQMLYADISRLPDILFLDLNMPRKTGFECLAEIKLNNELKKLPVVIFSTSFDHNIADLLYENGAYFYVRKPASFSKLKSVILQAITEISNDFDLKPIKDKFVLNYS